MVLACAAADAAEAAHYAGRPLSDVIEEMRRDGLRLVYNTQLVPPSLRVTREPHAGEPIKMLEEMLEPLGLGVSRVGDNVYALVALTKSDSPQPAPASDARPPEELLQEVVVTTSRYGLANEVLASQTFLTQAELESLPKLADESLRAVQRLPGAASNGVSGLAHIRGGEENETQILLNGLALSEPFHLKDFLSPVSILDSRMIDGIDVSLGGFTVDQGDRMSAVVDARTVTAPQDLYFELGMSVFHSGALVAGKSADEDFKWLVSVRRSNLDEIADVVGKDIGEPNYNDAFGRVEFALADDTSLIFNVLASIDRVTALASSTDEEARVVYRNNYFWTELDHDWSAAAHSRLIASFTDVDNDRDGTVDDPAGEFGVVHDSRAYEILGLRLENDYLVRHFVNRWGLEVRQLHSDYAYSSEVTYAPDFPLPGDAGSQTTRNLDPSPSGHALAAFASSRFKPMARLTAEVGLRWDKQTYGNLEADTQLSPRVNVLFDLREGTRLRATWGAFFQPQAIDELQVQDGVDRFFSAQRSDQTIVSLEQDLAHEIQLRVEAYRKHYSHLMVRYENEFDQLRLLPELQPDRISVAPSSARATGVEILLSRRTAGPWSWWASYAWSRATDRIDGSDVPRSWDQRSTVQAGIHWSNELWDVTFAGTYHSSWPTTTLSVVSSSDASGNPVESVQVGERNAARIGDFRSLDLRVSRRFPLSRGEIDTFIEVTNALGDHNPCCVQYNVTEAPSGVIDLGTAVRNWPELVPSAGVLWKF
ncbi:MAG TPA: TonB-dependent receptor [Steroidobacteraceae bacterium]|nr:TonB-dependent receptor [Steroidobacteraceae bacterium]